MKLLKKHARGALCLLLSLSILGGTLLYAFGTAADDYEETLLGELSKDFESGDPGAISSGNGDPGGKSYGAYQFASNYNGPRNFFEWCLLPERNTAYQAIGQRLKDAYEADGSSYGYTFDTTWVAIADDSYDIFLNAQRDYVEVSYYRQAAQDIAKKYPGFDISNYSIALRNVLLSRAVQHGSYGVVSVMDYVFGKLGGFKNQPEAELIQAIYEESGEVRDPDGRDGEECMTGETARKQGVEGKVMSWFWGSSADVQVGVYMRLRINEPAKAFNMLAKYGYTDAPLNEGIYQFSPADNSQLAVKVQDGSVTLNTGDNSESQQFRLTYYASGYYTITNVENQLRLTAAKDGTLTLAAPTAHNNQMWKLEGMNSGFSIQNRDTLQFLSAAEVSAGAVLQGGEEAAQWQVGKIGSAWTLTGAAYPTYANDLKVGSATIPLRGTLRCVDTIQSVNISIYDSNGELAVFPARSGLINEYTYDLSNMDNHIAFGSLRAGVYTFVISALSNGETDNRFRMESKFFVSDGNYLLLFDACGGTSSAESMSVAAGQAYGVLPTAVKDGYVFLGWFTKPDGGTQITSNMITGAANQTLYAHYEKAYTYQFLNYDGSVIASGALRAGEVIPAVTDIPTRPSDSTSFYTFTGWDGYSEGMTITGDITFTAQYDAHALSTLPEMVTRTYRIENDLLRSIPMATSVSTLLDGLAPGEYITVGNRLPGDTLVGTGMTVQYAVDGKVLQTLTAVVTGDTNGDGKFTITDMVQLQSHLLGRTPLTGAALEAADINGDGSVTITDLVQATSVLLGKTSVKPH